MSGDLPTTTTSDVPAWITLADDLVTPDVLCSLGMRPYLMTGALVGDLRQHFASRNQIEDPTLRHLIWDATPASAMVIESVTRWRPDASGQRPAVVVKRNTFTAVSMGINDERQGEYDPEGRAQFEAFWRGSHTLFCLDDEAGGAERLAVEVARELLEFGPELRRHLKLNKFKLVDVDQLHRLREAAGGYAVPVTVAYAYAEGWTVLPNAPRLKKITLRSLLDEMA